MYFSFDENNKTSKPMWYDPQPTDYKGVCGDVNTKLELVGFFSYKADHYLCRNKKSFKKITTKTKSDVLDGIATVVNGHRTYVTTETKFKRCRLIK